MRGMELVSTRTPDHSNEDGRHVRRCNRQGFTFVELLVAIVMLAILLSFAVPAVGRGVRQAKADRAAYAIKQDLEQAFSLAMRERRPVLLAIDTIQRIYTIADRATGAVVVRRAMGLGASEYGLTRLGASATTLTIYPNGLAADSVRLFAEVGDHRRLVRLARGGHVRVSSY